MGHGENIGIGRFFAPLVEAHTSELAVLDLQAAHRRPERDFASATLDFRLASVVQLREGHRGHPHAVARAVGKKGFPENVNTEMRVGPMEFLVESAHEDNAPEAFNRALRLAAPAKPLKRSEEHTSELQSLAYLVCRLLLEKKKHTD